MLRLAQPGTEHFSSPIRTEISPCVYKHIGFFTKKPALALVQVFQLPTPERWVAEETLRC